MFLLSQMLPIITGKTEVTNGVLSQILPTYVDTKPSKGPDADNKTVDKKEPIEKSNEKTKPSKGPDADNKTVDKKEPIEKSNEKTKPSKGPDADNKTVDKKEPIEKSNEKKNLVIDIDEKFVCSPNFSTIGSMNKLRIFYQLYDCWNDQELEAFGTLQNALIKYHAHCISPIIDRNDDEVEVFKKSLMNHLKNDSDVMITIKEIISDTLQQSDDHMFKMARDRLLSMDSNSIQVPHSLCDMIKLNLPYDDPLDAVFQPSRNRPMSNAMLYPMDETNTDIHIPRLSRNRPMSNAMLYPMDETNTDIHIPRLSRNRPMSNAMLYPMDETNTDIHIPRLSLQ
jgi:hypothetical protein